ncbi:MAG: hypothetical protein ABI886_03580 [Betaproteobacteria bacterium]
MTVVRVLLHCAWVALSLLAFAAYAHEGHDDSTPGVPAAIAGGVPRVEANSDLFEIVGVIDNGTMTLFLDRYSTNEPIANAKIDVEIGSVNGVAQQNVDGTYTFKHALLVQPAQLPITFAIAAVGESDLLTAAVVIPDLTADGAHSTAAPQWKWWWWVAGGLHLLGMIALAWLLLRRHRAKETAP